MKKRYFLSSDNDGHHYLVEAAHREEWNTWVELDSDDERSWDTPCFATRIDHYSNVEFLA